MVYRHAREGRRWRALEVSTGRGILSNMMLTDPGARIEGDAVEILAAVFAVTVGLLEESMDQFTADHLAHIHLARVHAQLAQAGYVVRDLEATE